MDYLRWHQHGKDELAHYAKDALYDGQFLQETAPRSASRARLFPMGWKELEGVHNRGDYDLSRHMQFSGKDLQYIDQDDNNAFQVRRRN